MSVAKDGKKGVKNIRVAKVRDKNPRQAPGETCCLHSVALEQAASESNRAGTLKACLTKTVMHEKSAEGRSFRDGILEAGSHAGGHLLIPGFCRADLGEFVSILVLQIVRNFRQISQRILMAKFSRKFFGLVSPGLQAPPPQKKSRPKFAGILLQFRFLSPTFFHADFLLAGETNIRPQKLGKCCVVKMV